jgi:hypothetical protein
MIVRMRAAVDPPLLDEENAAFATSGLMVSVAARNEANVPSVARALGCRISPDRRRVTVLLVAAQSAPVLRDLRANGRIAVVFTQPSTHRTIQLKGSDARIEAALPGDTSLVRQAAARLVRDMAAVGFPASFVETMFAHAAEDLLAVAFTPAAGFAQTPGPQAGKPL